MSANIPKHPDLPAQYGSVETSAIDWSLVEPYRFGSRTAEFLMPTLRHLCRRHLRDPGRRPRSDQRQLSRQSSRFHPATRARRSRPSHMAQLVACVSRGRYDLEPVVLLLTRGACSR
jgi:hypothetical protein